MSASPQRVEYLTVDLGSSMCRKCAFDRDPRDLVSEAQAFRRGHLLTGGEALVDGVSISTGHFPQDIELDGVTDEGGRVEEPAGFRGQPGQPGECRDPSARSGRLAGGRFDVIVNSKSAERPATEGLNMDEQVTPDAIMQLGMGFWGSKALLSAVELGVFTTLARKPRSAKELMGELGLQQRGTVDFLDALVALDMLQRSDDTYSNTPATDLFLDREKPTYVGGLLEMANARLYPFWASLTEALRTGYPQNEAKVGENFFHALYQDADRLKQFLHAMTGVSMGSAVAIAEKFPWADHSSVVDIGTAQGCVPVQVAMRHPHLTGGGFDLPPVRPIFEDYVSDIGLSDRLTFHAGDFFADPLPNADVFVMGHILHDWSLEEKLLLLRKAYDALPRDGALIVYESIIDDDRRTNAFGLLMSVNMLIETQDGFDYTGADCQAWMAEVGFRHSYVEPLVGPESMVVGLK